MPKRSPEEFDERSFVYNNQQARGGQPKSSSPWDAIAPQQREPSVRLNADIPLRLDQKLTAKAQTLGVSKAKLVRSLLEWALEDEEV